MQNVKIVYKDIVINQDNIDAFRMLRGVRGRFHPDSNTITVHRYTLSHDLRLDANDTVYTKIQQLKDFEPFILRHEKHHAQNHAFIGDKLLYSHNIYEYISLCCLDEVSAYSAQHLLPHETSTPAILSAILDGFKYFQDVQHRYLSMFYNYSIQNIASFSNTKNANAVIKIHGQKYFEQDFGSDFQYALCKYFVFNGVAVFSKEKLTQDVIESALYRNVYKKIQELKKSCIAYADRIIDVAIQHK